MKYSTPLQDTHYENVPEAERRLLGSIVVFNDNPYTVSQISPDFVATLSPTREHLSGEKPIKVHLSDKGFKHFQAFPLGFCNYFFEEDTFIGVCKVNRVSARRVNQGLVSGNCSVRNERGGLNLENIRTSQAFWEMVKNIYPTYDEVMEELAPKNSIAISRDFALKRMEGNITHLWYRDINNSIAVCIGDTVILPSSNRNFYETLVEDENLPNKILLI